MSTIGFYRQFKLYGRYGGTFILIYLPYDWKYLESTVARFVHISCPEAPFVG